jgi:hypothetical protein
MEEVEGYLTAEEAARGDIPERFAQIIAVWYAPSGDRATVELMTNEPPATHAITCECYREDGRWFADTAG